MGEDKKDFLVQGLRQWNTPYLPGEYKFPRKTLLGNSLWESNHKLGETEEFGQMTASINGALCHVT